MNCQVCGSEYGHRLECPTLGLTPVLDLKATMMIEPFDDTKKIAFALAEIESLRAQLASARKALQFIADGYENHDINHVDYRVTVYQVATDALKDLP